MANQLTMNAARAASILRRARACVLLHFSFWPGAARRSALTAGVLLAFLLAVPAAPAQVATFDFDTGTPTLSPYQGLPVDQTSGGATAHFSAAVGAYSIQTASSLGGMRLSMFSGKFPVPGNQIGSVLEIRFSQWVTNLSFPFATVQIQPIENETPLELRAYLDSTNSLVGVTNATGVYGGPSGNDSWPMGTLTFQSASPFNLVRIRVPTLVPRPPTGQATDFALDTVSVGLAGGPAGSITATSAPAGSGMILGGGGYSVGLPATLVALANLGYGFVNWTEAGVQVSTATTYSFTTTGDRVLSANFVPTYTITTSAAPTAGGTTSGGGTYNSGSNVTVVATAKAGYAFYNWTQGGTAVSSAASYNFVASANRTLVANLVRTYAIVASAAPLAGGTTSGSGIYNSGSNVTVVATANAGWAFVNWTQAGTPVSPTASYSFPASVSRTLVANFTALPAPQLNLVVAAQGSVAVSWPATATGYALQECSMLNPPDWRATTNEVGSVNGQSQVTLPTVPGARFFRLHGP